MSKKVLITGASSGIGKATAIYLAEKGYHVIGTTRNPENIGKDLKEKEKLTIIKMDVTDRYSIITGLKHALKLFDNQLDILINNAGISHVTPFESISEKHERKIMETNFFGVAALIRSALPVLRKNENSIIINISSLAGKIGIPFQSYYAASKFALEGLTESLRMELSPFGIKVILVEPGDIATPISSHHLLPDNIPEHYKVYYDQVRDAAHGNVKKAESPLTIAKLIYEIINTPNPVLRYPVGKSSKAIVFALKFLPQRIKEKLIMKNYRMDQ